jgi:hypothetical protein
MKLENTIKAGNTREEGNAAVNIVIETQVLHGTKYQSVSSCLEEEHNRIVEEIMKVLSDRSIAVLHEIKVS